MASSARSVALCRDPLDREEVWVREGGRRPGGPGGRDPTSLVLVRRGALAVPGDDAEHVADPCTAVLLWERPPPERGDDQLVIELGPRLAAERLHGLSRQRDVALPLSPRLQLAVAELVATRRGQPEPVVAQAALALVDAILAAARAHRRERRARRAAGMPRRLALAAILALHRDLSINRSIAELAEELGCSAYHLMHAFRAEVGAPMRAYRLRARLGVALHCLVDGHDDLCTLAIELGFASHSHFTDAFTRELGASPSRLRARLQGRARATGIG